MLYDVGQELAPKSATGSIAALTIMDGLMVKKTNLQRQLDDINAAIAAIEKNPEVEMILNLLQKTGRY